MNKRITILLLIIGILTTLSVNANLQTNLIDYWTFDTSSDTQVGSANGNNMSRTGATYNANGKINGAYSYDGTNDYFSNSEAPIKAITGSHTISMWINTTTCTNDYETWFSRGDEPSAGHTSFRRKNTCANTDDNIAFYVRTTTGVQTIFSTGIDIDDGEWYFVVGTFNATNGAMRLYINGGINGTGTRTGTYSTNSGTSYIGQIGSLARDYNGEIDEVAIWDRVLTDAEVEELYNNGTGLQYPFSVTPTTNQKTEKTSKIEQINPIIINGFGFSNVVTGTFEVTNTTNITATFTINPLAQSGDSEIQCRINIDGSYHNSTITRSLTHNTYGSLYTLSSTFEETIGNHTAELQCRRSSGSPNILLENSIGVIHELIDSNGIKINYDEITGINKAITTSTYTKISEINFTTTNETITTGMKKGIIIDGFLEYMYDSTGEISTYITINGTKTGEYPRYGNIGTTGIIGGLGLNELTNSDSVTIPIALYAKSSTSDGDIQGNIIIKEIILHEDELQSEYLNNTNFNGGYSTIKSITINNTDHANANLLVKAGIPHETTSGGARSTFRLKTANETGTTITRDVVNANQNGVAIIQDVFNITAGITTLTLEGTSNNTIYVRGGDLTAYITNLIPFQEDSYTITAYNQWNGSSIQNFNVTIESTGNTFPTTTGIVTIPVENGLENITITSAGYINRTITNHNTTTNLNTSIYQSEVSIQATEINTLINILNFSLQTENGINTTTTGTIFLYPNLGTYTWNWSNNIGYFNQTNLAFTIDEQIETLTIQNLYARNISFIDSISSGTITPSCEQDTFTYNAYDYLIHKSTNNMTCTLFGYEQKVLTLASMPDTSVYNMTPVSLNINFSEQTSGIIQSGDTFIQEFNSTQIALPQENITLDIVKVTFNPDENGKYQQIFSYDNDGNTTIAEQILVQSVDLQQTIKVTGNTQAIIGARVCSKFPLNEEYWTTYCDFTNDVGDVLIQVNDQNTYLICAQAEGYEPKCELHYIPASNQDTITINMISTEQQEGTNIVTTSCLPIYNQDQTCSLEVIAYQPEYSICINVTKYNGTTSSTQTCAYDSVGETFIYTLNQAYDYYNLSIELTGTEIAKIYHQNGTDPATIKINYQSGNHTGGTILEKVKDNTAFFIAIHIILIILAVIVGYMIEKYFNGYGVYGSGLWFLFMGMAGFSILYIPAIVIMVNFMMERILPLFRN